MSPRQQRRIALRDLVGRRWPGSDPAAVDDAIREGRILVEGRVLANPTALVAVGAPVRWIPVAELAGRRKLGWALDHYGVDAGGRVVLDVGASTGGFTAAWLDAGAARVYAVDAGHGQLLGSLRQDPRVVNLERTNVADAGPALGGALVDAVSVDVSYLSLSAAVAQLPVASLRPAAVLLGLVKPMFELRLAGIPEDGATLTHARDTAVRGVAAAGWLVLGADECPVRGGKGAVEFLVHATRPAPEG